MWLSDDVVEVLRGGAVIFAFLVVVNPRSVGAASEFTVHRLQQYHLNGQSYGSVGSVVGVEATAVSESGSMHRKCVMAHIGDVTPDVYQKVAQSGALALLIILPANMSAVSPAALGLIGELEEAMLSQQVDMAVYFARDNPELAAIYRNIASRSPSAAKTAAASFLNSLSSDGYQMVLSGPENKRIKDMAITNIQGQLTGYGSAHSLPTIALVAHYDTLAAAAELSYGADGNGSGAAALLELARVLSRLYRAKHTQPSANVIFLLAGGGPLNYQGSKRFLEEQLEHSEDSLLSGGPRLVLCLDSLTASDGLRLHVSKPPREGSLMAAFYDNLVKAGQLHGVEVSLVHRKINLRDTEHPWEHHRYSLRRVPAATLSALHAPRRTQLTDTHAPLRRLLRGTEVLQAALVATLYGSEVRALPSSLAASEASLEGWQRLLSAQPRSPQLLLPAGRHPLLQLLQEALQRHTEDVTVTVARPDKQEPEWGFHSGTGGVLTAYATKPASFDLLLSLVVAAYLGAVWAALQQLPRLRALLLAALPKERSNGRLKYKTR